MTLTAAPAASPERTVGRDDLADFAAKLAVGQACQGGCGGRATWAAVAGTDDQRFGCNQEIGGLLNAEFVWFLHSLP